MRIHAEISAIQKPSSEPVYLSITKDNYSFDSRFLEKATFRIPSNIDLDLFVIICVVGLADRNITRHQGTRWGREFDISIKVSEPEHWNSDSVKNNLSLVLNQLTGDVWKFNFTKGNHGVNRQAYLEFADGDIQPYELVPYSDGLDSLCFGQVLSKEKKRQLRITAKNRGMGAVDSKWCKDGIRRVSIPLRLAKFGGQEKTYRTRPFIFFLCCAVAAKWSNSNIIHIPENGQGILSPVFNPKGGEWTYWGSHPIFTNKLESFIEAGLQYSVKFQHPNIWKTKSEAILAAFKDVDVIPNSNSCVTDERQSFGQAKHCGICANCLLRRVSFFCAGVKGANDEYYYGNLKEAELANMTPDKIKHKCFKAHQDTAYHAVWAMENFARFEDSAIVDSEYEIRKHAYELSETGFCLEAEAEQGIKKVIRKHKEEWDSFLFTLPSDSWVKKNLGY